MACYAQYPMASLWGIWRARTRIFSAQLIPEWPFGELVKQAATARPPELPAATPSVPDPSVSLRGI